MSTREVVIAAVIAHDRTRAPTAPCSAANGTQKFIRLLGAVNLTETHLQLAKLPPPRLASGHEGLPLGQGGRVADFLG